MRHGGARSVEISAAVADERLSLAIANDGTPFGDGAGRAEPWTIRERVERLRGIMTVEDGTNPRLHIELPIGRA